ncbi:MAG: hypothetical protein LBH13_08415 [Cellulomonadaceae bacterium]|jgi:hypothetical protein|nr:hypothetical protein [Cellulomonadaceae bacterium]
MPTTYPRVQVTRTPEVDRILCEGNRRWPGRPAGATLIALASEALEPAAQSGVQTSRSSHLMTFTSPQPLTDALLQTALDED